MILRKISSFLLLWMTLVLGAVAQNPQIDSLELVLQGLHDRSTELEIHLKLSELYRKTGLIEPSELHASQALEMCQKHFKGTVKEAEALKELGIIYWMMANNDSASILFHSALDIFLKRGSESEAGRIYNNLGLVEYRQSNYPAAVKWFLEAERILKENGDEEGLSLTYNNLAATYSKMRYYRQGIAISHRSLQLKEKSGDLKGMANTLNNLGSLYYALESRDTAFRYFKSAMNIKKSLNDLPGLANTYGNIANIFTDLKEFDSAYAYQLGALKLRGQIQDVYGTALNKAAIGDLLTELGRYDEAESYLIEAENELDALGDPYEIAQVNLFLSNLFKAKGKYEKAFAHFQKFHSLSDSLRSEANLKEVGRLEAERIYAQEQTELLLEKTEAERKKVRFRSLLIIAVLILLLLTAVIYHVVQSRRHTRLLNTILKKKNAIITNNSLRLQTESRGLVDQNEVKNKVFSILSHDLKSPLYQIRQLMELYEDGELSRDEFIDFKDQLISKLDGTIEMTDNMLTWASRLIRGEMMVSEGVEIGTLVNKISSHLDSRLMEKNITFKVDVPSPCKLKVDSELLTFVIRNILHNAIKFTPEGGTISLRAECYEDSTSIAISDNGIGMSAEVLSKLFSTETISGSGTNKESGAGIGLIMCKELIQLAKGDISVESEEGIGSTFTITIQKEI